MSPNQQEAPRWLLPSLFLSAAISTIPIYGFWVHAARDPQWIMILLSLAWSLAWIFAVIAVVVFVIRPGLRKQAIWMLVYLVLALAFGFGALHQAFNELFAG